MWPLVEPRGSRSTVWMKAAITGASGLVGGNLAIELAGRGASIRCLRRGSSRVAHLAAVPIDWVEGDVDDVASLERAFRDTDVVFHCAAIVGLRGDAAPAMQKTNVEGTRHVIEAARRSGVRRLVHCSSIVAAAVSESDSPVDETHAWNLDRHGVGDEYAKTKLAAQRLVLEAAHDGLDAVVVQPGFLFGPYDAKPSSGKMIRDIVRGQIPSLLDGTNSFVDVRDVCRGMIAAAERGRRGEVYILGGWNLTYAEVFRKIAAVAGVEPPKRYLPPFVLRLFGYLGDLQERFTSGDPLANSTTVAWFFLRGFAMSSAKAERELGYRISPLEPAIGDAIAWFRANGML